MGNSQLLGRFLCYNNMIPILIFIFGNFALSSSEPSLTCPFPLPSRIEPCICQLDNNYRMFLTCHFRSNFTSEDLGKIVSEFYYNNNIYSFEIKGSWSWYQQNRAFSKFFGHLDKNNIGRLNITNFIMRDIMPNVTDSLIQDGAFEGSHGGIERIEINIPNYETNLSTNINLDNVLAYAGPTLKSLKLSHLKYLSSSSFWSTPQLTEIVFMHPAFDHIPAKTFSGQYLPNLSTFELNKFSGEMIIESFAFTNLLNLTNLKMTSMNSIENIERKAFNNLFNVHTIDLTGTVINKVGEDAFVNFSSLKEFSLVSVLSKNVTYLPRLFSNSPLLKAVNIDNSYFENIAKDFFVGTPNVETIKFSENKKLKKLIIQDLGDLRVLSLVENRPRTPLYIELRNLSKLESFREGSKQIASASFSDMQNLRQISINNWLLETIFIDSTPNIETLDLHESRLLNHTGVATSLHNLLHPNINIDLGSTNIRTLDEFTFRPLIERLNGNSESTGNINLSGVKLDCGCDVKWLVADIGRTDFFSGTRCTGSTKPYYLSQVDPLLLKKMCPPEY